MTNEQHIEFQLTGKLRPEQFGLLTAYVTALMVGQTEQPDIVLTNLADELTEAEALSSAAERYDVRYLDRVYIPDKGREVLLTTRSAFERFFRENETPKSLYQATRAWTNLARHFVEGHGYQEMGITYHHCQCPLQGHSSEQSASPSGYRDYSRRVGCEPDSLQGLALYAEEHPNAVRSTRNSDLSCISPATMEVINVYLDGLKRVEQN